MEIRQKVISARNKGELERKVAKFIFSVRPNGGVDPLPYIKCRAYLQRPTKKMKIDYGVNND